MASKFKLEFSLIACMTNTMMGSMWYLDSSALFQMMGNRDFFSHLEEKYFHMHIDMEDDRRYSVIEIGTVATQRESSSLLKLKDFIFVPNLKENIIFATVLGDRGNHAIFSKGKEFLRHITTG